MNFLLFIASGLGAEKAHSLVEMKDSTGWPRYNYITRFLLSAVKWGFLASLVYSVAN